MVLCLPVFDAVRSRTRAGPGPSSCRLSSDVDKKIEISCCNHPFIGTFELIDLCNADNLPALSTPFPTALLVRWCLEVWKMRSATFVSNATVACHYCFETTRKYRFCPYIYTWGSQNSYNLPKAIAWLRRKPRLPLWQSV